MGYQKERERKEQKLYSSKKREEKEKRERIR